MIQNRQASIKIFIGCMYSGKTSEIISESRRQLGIGKKVLCVNHSADTRYGDDNFLYSHDMNKISCIKTNDLSEINIEEIKNSDCIMVNEGQFFSKLVENVVKWCEQYGKDVVVTGLDGDFKRGKFGEILDLIPYANYVVKKAALCPECGDGTEAYFTHRKTKETSQILIGSKEYVPLCRKHYILNNSN